MQEQELVPAPAICLVLLSQYPKRLIRTPSQPFPPFGVKHHSVTTGLACLFVNLQKCAVLLVICFKVSQQNVRFSLSPNSLAQGLTCSPQSEGGRR